MGSTPVGGLEKSFSEYFNLRTLLHYLHFIQVTNPFRIIIMIMMVTMIMTMIMIILMITIIIIIIITIIIIIIITIIIIIIILVIWLTEPDGSVYLTITPACSNRSNSSFILPFSTWYCRVNRDCIFTP